MLFKLNFSRAARAFHPPLNVSENEAVLKLRRVVCVRNFLKDDDGGIIIKLLE